MDEQQHAVLIQIMGLNYRLAKGAKNSKSTKAPTKSDAEEQQLKRYHN